MRDHQRTSYGLVCVEGRDVFPGNCVSDHQRERYSQTHVGVEGRNMIQGHCVRDISERHILIWVLKAETCFRERRLGHVYLQ